MLLDTALREPFQLKQPSQRRCKDHFKLRGILFLRNMLQQLQEMRPPAGNRRYFNPFVGRMHVAERRTERNHVQMRIFLEEEAAFQAGVDGFDFRFLCKNRATVPVPPRFFVSIADLQTERQLISSQLSAILMLFPRRENRISAKEA